MVLQQKVNLKDIYLRAFNDPCKCNLSACLYGAQDKGGEAADIYIFSGWPQLIPQPSRYQGLWQQWHIISGDTVSFVTEWKIRRRLLRSIKRKNSHKEFPVINISKK